MKRQVLSQLRRSVLTTPEAAADANRHANCWPVVLACLVAGAYPNLARRNPGQATYATRFHRKAKVRSESAVSNGGSPATPWIIFDEITRLGGATILDTVSFKAQASQLTASEVYCMALTFFPHLFCTDVCVRARVYVCICVRGCVCVCGCVCVFVFHL